MSGQLIFLNVGGTIFTTTVATLTKYPDSLLAAMFNLESERPPARKDDKGRKLLSTEIIPRDSFSYSQRPPMSLPHLSENRSEAQRECENKKSIKSSLSSCASSLFTSSWLYGCSRNLIWNIIKFWNWIKPCSEVICGQNGVK